MRLYKFDAPKPKTYRYHYSNPESQGSLLKETHSFPKQIDADKFTISDGYMDRIQVWHPAGCKKAFSFLNTAWLPDALPPLSDDELRNFAQHLFEMESPPIHVRVIYYYNVATGYDCPYIVAIGNKN